jgi:hypothetical protein
MNKNESKYFNTAIKMDKALIKLIEKKDFEYITIKEICETAQVNRSTFYLHYNNTSDLLKETTKYITDGYNFSSTFQYAENLVSVTGFVDNLLRSNCHVGNMFAYCYSLTTTDIEIPAIPATSESTGNPTIGGIFNNCSKLTAKIEKLLPGGGFAVNNVDMNLAFYNTSALTGTIPVDRLWNSGKTWNKTSSTFKGSALVSQAPAAWGGTKTEAKAE